MSGIRLATIQHGLESVAGTLVAATFKYPGTGTLVFEDKVERPGYLTAEAGENTIEDSFVSQTGTTLNLNDAPCSVELLAYMLNIGVKSVPGPASSFAFAFPTTAVNAIGSMTFEYATAAQEYEAGYGFLEKFSISGDGGANNGVVQFNGVVRARKSAASTKTASLGVYANHQPLVINATTKFSIDAVGTAAGTAAHLSGTLRGFSLDCETGWKPGHYADARADKDFSLPEGGGNNWKITGNLKILLNATAITEIANARAGTGRIVYIALAGTASRVCAIALPLTFTAAPTIGDTVENDLILCSFPYAAGYSRTASAQGASITLTTSASLTIT